MAVRIADMLLRLAFVVNLVLGVLFWIGKAGGGLVLLHMLVGILLVALVWFIGLAQAVVRGGSLGLMVGTFLIGLALAIVGLGQNSFLNTNPHWIIQVIHVILAFAAIGAGEAAAARYRRATIV